MRITLDQAATLLKNDIVAIPTETVYGLAASIHSPQALEKLYALKKRPKENPLIVHVATLEDLIPFVESLPNTELTKLWPGPLTLILKAKNLSPLVTANLSTVAVRIPNHPLTLKLLQQTGPLVAPSANISGKPSATTPDHIEFDFGHSFPILDGGPCQNGLESTILSEKDGLYRILRQGALSQDYLATLLGYKPEIILPGAKPECPGQLFKHYAPDATLVTTLPAEAVLGFTDRTYTLPLIPLGPSTAPHLIASRLYQALREIDLKGYRRVLLDLDFPDEGLYKTIRERLLKAKG